MSDSLWPHGLQQNRLLCPSLSPIAWSNSCPLSQWCHQISHPLLPSSTPAFNLSQNRSLFQLVGSLYQEAKVLELELQLQHQSFSMNIQSRFPLGLTGLISLLSKGLSRVFSSTTIPKHQFFGTQPSLWSSSNPDMTSGKTIDLTIWNFVGKVMSLLFNMLSRFVVAFLPRIKCLLISYWKESKVEVAKSFTI